MPNDEIFQLRNQLSTVVGRLYELTGAQTTIETLKYEINLIKVSEKASLPHPSVGQWSSEVTWESETPAEAKTEKRARRA
jgi:hypothetical protein